MEMKEMAMTIARELSAKKATDIAVINIGEKSAFADYFINVTAGSERQLGALLDVVEDQAAILGLVEKGVEGRSGTGWMLVDCGDIIVNIFTAETREKYSLDKLWSDCETEYIEE